MLLAQENDALGCTFDAFALRCFCCCCTQDVLRAVSTGLKGGHVNFGSSGISGMDPGGGDSGEVGCHTDVEDAISEPRKGKDPHWLELRSMGEAGTAALEAYVKDLCTMEDGWGYADIKIAKKRLDGARHVLSKKHKMVPPVRRLQNNPRAKCKCTPV